MNDKITNENEYICWLNPKQFHEDPTQLNLVVINYRWLLRIEKSVWK